MGTVDLAVRHWRLISGLALGLATVTFVTALVGKRSYTSNGTFLPQSSSSRLTTMAGIAAQLGLSVQPDQSGDSPDFYATILKARPTLERVIQEQYKVSGSAKTATLVDLLAPMPLPMLQRREVAINVLNGRTNVAILRNVGIVRVSATANDPLLAQQIVQNLFRYVNELNLDIRRQRAADEARFIDERLGTARSELYAAEDRLQSFLKSNRDLGSVSEGTFLRERLERDVDMKQQIYTSLALAYEQSRLDEVRNTSVISVIEQPGFPLFPNSRHVLVKLLLAVGIGAFLGLALGWLAERERFAGVSRHTRFGRFFSSRSPGARARTGQTGNKSAAQGR